MTPAEKLFARMERTRDGWGEDDFRRLYEGFGFTAKEGGNHTTYIHPEYDDLRTQVARHTSLPKGYARDAVRLIKELIRRKALSERDEPPDNQSE